MWPIYIDVAFVSHASSLRPNRDPPSYLHSSNVNQKILKPYFTIKYGLFRAPRAHALQAWRRR